MNIKKRPKNSGFSLIEILISIAVAAVILPGIVILLSLSTFSTSQGETYTKAYSIAQREMEQVYADKNDNWDLIVTSPSYNEDEFTIKKDVINIHTDTEDYVDEKDVIIEVSWNERGETTNVELRSYVARY